MDPTDPNSSYDPEALMDKLREHWEAFPAKLEAAHEDLRSRSIEGHDHDHAVAITLSGDRKSFRISINPDSYSSLSSGELAQRIEAAWADAGAQLDRIFEDYERQVEKSVLEPIQRVNRRFQDEQARLALEPSESEDPRGSSEPRPALRSTDEPRRPAQPQPAQPQPRPSRGEGARPASPAAPETEPMNFPPLPS